LKKSMYCGVNKKGISNNRGQGRESLPSSRSESPRGKVTGNTAVITGNRVGGVTQDPPSRGKPVIQSGSEGVVAFLGGG